jgi:hypothetical protein
MRQKKNSSTPLFDDNVKMKLDYAIDLWYGFYNWTRKLLDEKDINYLHYKGIKGLHLFIFVLFFYPFVYIRLNGFNCVPFPFNLLRKKNKQKFNATKKASNLKQKVTQIKKKIKNLGKNSENRDLKFKLRKHKKKIKENKKKIAKVVKGNISRVTKREQYLLDSKNAEKVFNVSMNRALRGDNALLEKNFRVKDGFLDLSEHGHFICDQKVFDFWIEYGQKSISKFSDNVKNFTKILHGFGVSKGLPMNVLDLKEGLNVFLDNYIETDSEPDSSDEQSWSE